MRSTMPHDKTREKIVRSHMTMQEEGPGGKDRLPHQKIVVQGRATQEPVYRFPLEELAFNKANGRIKSEVLEKEAELGRELEPSSAEDQATIKELLLILRPDENEKIREDLKKNGQLQPGIITCDGFVVNGNRRKAILDDLYHETGSEQFKYLDVQVLPKDITKAELWLIEAGIQLSTPQQLDYSPINHLLKLREGVMSGLNINEMASRIYGVTEERIAFDLERLKLIDEYLTDYIEKPKRYNLVRQLNEHFIDLQNILEWAKRPRGPTHIDWDPDDSDKNELKIVGFHCIRDKFSHMSIRGLKELFATRASWQSLRQAVELQIDVGSEESPHENNDTLEGTTAIDEDDSFADAVPPGSDTTSTAEEQDIEDERRWRDTHDKPLKRLYEDAKEQLQIVRESRRPTALAKRALRMIEAILPSDETRGEPELDEILRRIITATNDLRKTLGKQQGRRS